MATCIISGTVTGGGGVPIEGAIVRIRTIEPVLVGNAALAAEDLTTKTIADGTWSLTVTQGLAAQVDIPAVSLAADIQVPELATVQFSSLTLYARGSLTPETILSEHGPSMGGDLTGSSPNPSVVGLKGIQLIGANPANGQTWVYSSVNGGFIAGYASDGVATLTEGSGIDITGSATNPIIGVATAGIVAAMLGSGAAASNVGSLSGDLTGALPGPTIASGAITDTKIAAGAAIAWAKINKTGAVASDVGAIATGDAVTSVTGGTCITVTGGMAPTISVTSASITNSQLASGAAATNVGSLSGVLSGSLPSPTFAAGAIVNADVNAAAAIAWSKVSKVGAAPGDIGAENPSNKGAANGYAPLDASSKVPFANLPAATPITHAASHASAGSDPVSPVSIGAAAIAHTHAESEVTGLVSDLGSKLDKSTGGTVVGDTSFSGTVTINGSLIVPGSFSPQGAIMVKKTGTATGPSPLKDSYDLLWQASIWGGVVAESRRAGFRLVPTAVDQAKLSLYGINGDDILGSEVGYFDTVTGAWHGLLVGNVTGDLTGDVTGDVTGTLTGNCTGSAGSITGNLTGDVTSTGMATTVAYVATSSATNVHAAELLANAATDANTPSAIVKRSAGGNFTATTITANLTGNATTASDGLASASGTAPLTLNLAAKALTGSVADAAAGSKGIVQLAGDLGGTAAAPTVVTVGTSTAALVHSAELLANAATSANTPSTIVKRDGSGNFTAGTITATLTGSATSATSFTGSLTGDVTGTQAATVVGKIQGNAVLTGTPTDGQILKWVTANNRWEASTPAYVTGITAGTGINVSGSGNITVNLTTPVTVANGGTGAGTLTGVVHGNGTGAFTAGNVALASEVSGQLGVANGGTGAATLTGLLRGNGVGAITGGASVGLTTEVTGLLPVANGGIGVGTVTGVLHGNGTSPVTAGAVILGSEVSGTLPVPNGGTGAATLTGLLRGNGTGAITGSATVNLASETTGTLGVANGGTGITSLTAGYIPFGVGSSPLGSDSALFWDNTNKRLGVGNASPGYRLDVAESFGTTGATATSVQFTTTATAADTYDRYGVLSQGTATHTSGTLSGVWGNVGRVAATGSGGTTSNLGSYVARGYVETGAIATSRYGVFIEDVTGSGTLTNQYGVYLPALTKGSTSNWALYSQGSATPSAHAGKFAFGQTNIPTREVDLSGTMRFRGIAEPAVSESGSATIYFNSSTSKWRASISGAAYVDIIGSNGVTGSGTANQVAYWGTTTGLTSSGTLVVDAISNHVGIMTSSPTLPLDVIGAIGTSVGYYIDGILVVQGGTYPGSVPEGIAIGANTVPSLYSVVIGENSASNASGTAQNTVVGAIAAGQLTSGTSNTLVGRYSGNAITTGNDNVMVGDNVGTGMAGSGNVVIGRSAGVTYTGDNNVLIGKSASLGGSASSAVAIGYQSTVSVSGGFVLGTANSLIGIRTSSPNLPCDINGAIATRKGSDLSLSNGLNSNISLSAFSYFRITGPTDAFSLGGFTNPYDGRQLTVQNTLNQTMTIVNEDASSTVTNRIKTLSGANVVLRTTLPSSATFIYDATDQRWVLISSN